MSAAARPSATPTLWMSRATIVIGWSLILSGLALFGWDCLTWLRDGVWRQTYLADLWGRLPLGGDGPSAGWDEMRGLHHLLFRVLHWFGRFPISLTLAVAGFAVAWIGNGTHDRVERELARQIRGSRLERRG